MTDFYSLESKTLKLAPQEEHRIKAKRAIQNVIHLDEECHDLLPYLFSKEEMEWLRENIRT